MNHSFNLVVTAFAIQLGTKCGNAFGFSCALPSAAGRSQSHQIPCQPQRASSTSQLVLCSTSTDATAEKRRRGLLQRDSLPSSKRRVARAIRRRARRLARVRRKNNKAKQASTAAERPERQATPIVNDVADCQQQQTDADYPPNGGRETTATAMVAAEKPVRLAATATSVDSTTSSPGTALSSLVDDAASSSAPSSTSTTKRRSKSIKGRQIVKGGEGRGLWKSIFGPRPLLEVRSVDELSRLVDAEEWGLEDLSVVTWRGDRPSDAALKTRGGAAGVASCPEDVGVGINSSGVEVASVPHPVVQAVLERAAAGTMPSKHGDGRRIGLAIEGGGMRGCVAAGMASCLHFLGLADSFDSVYGASAGSLVGAYFVSRQVNGTAVYHDVLPSAGARFLDMAQFPHALGFQLPKVTMDGVTMMNGELETDGQSEKFAKVIGLDFLLGDVVGRVHALDFDSFIANDRLQPLHVVTSGVSSMSSVSLASRRGHFSTFDNLTSCIRASMLVPGLAGPLLSVPRDELANSASRYQPPWRKPQRRTLVPNWQTGVGTADAEIEDRKGVSKFVASRASSWAVGRWRRKKPRGFFKRGRERGGRRIADEHWTATAVGSAREGRSDDPELLVDAMVFEPLPYRSAIEDGCTDVVVLCTRPQGSQVLGKKPSIYETRVVKKYFEQHEDPAETSKISDYMQKLKHLRTYAEDALVLDEGSRTGLPQVAPAGGPGEGREAFVVAVAPEPSCKEVGQLEQDRKAILQGCRDGFAACYDLFVGSATAAEAAAAATDGGAAGVDGESDGVEIGPLTRSGAEMALDYFPDSMLSIPVDVNATFFQPGRLISDQPPSMSAVVPTDDGGAPRKRWSRPSQCDGTVVGNRGAAAAAVDDTEVEASSDGARGRLRRILSLGKLRRRPLPFRVAAEADDSDSASSADIAGSVKSDSDSDPTAAEDEPLACSER